MQRALSAGSPASTRAPERARDRAHRDELVRRRVEHLAAAVRDAAASGRLDGPEADSCARDLAVAAEGPSPDTARHLERLGLYVALLARAAGWPDDRCGLLRRASQLHDIGKVGIPDELRSNDGVFTREDRQIMERHVVIGHELLTGCSSPLLDLAASIALSHHERYDGGGYPNGLRGAAIPVEARIVAIADVFDALTTERRYKRAMSLNQARVLMLANRGTHFDAHLLDAFLDQMEGLERILREWSEPSSRTSRSSARTGGARR